MRRLSGAGLRLFVVMLCCFNAIAEVAAGEVHSWIEEKTKIGRSRLPEYILVLNGSVAIQPLAAAFSVCLRKLRDSVKPISFRDEKRFLAWPDGIAAVRLIDWQRSVEAGADRVIENAGDGIYPHLSSRRLSSVDTFDMVTKLCSSRLIIKLMADCNYISPQLAFSVPVSTFNQPVRGVSQENRSEAKYRSESGQYERAERHPELIVRSEKTVKASEPIWAFVLASLLLVFAPGVGIAMSYWGWLRLGLGIHLLWGISIVCVCAAVWAS